MKPSTLAVKVAERLATKGWQQDCYGSEKGPNCVMGAAYIIAKEGAPEITAFRQAMKLMPDATENNGAIGLNDLRGTTAEDMIMAALFAAELLKDEGK